MQRWMKQELLKGYLEMSIKQRTDFLTGKVMEPD
jgi:hypothetical protein